MSQKNETTVLVLTLLIMLGIVGLGVWWFLLRPDTKIGNFNNPNTQSPSNNQSLPNPISFGEQAITTGDLASTKRTGIEALAAKKYDQAIANLEATLRTNKNDPETLIFLNNARIKDQKSYAIAVSVPMGSDPNGSLEILRGVAQAQNEINQAGKINGVALKVAITNDNNSPEIAQQIATQLVNNQNVLGVVGPFSSDVTLAAGTVYQSGQLVAISPTSTSVKLSGFSPYVFRTVPSDYVAARALANYMETKLQQKNAAVFFNSQSAYSQSLKAEFVSAVSLAGGQVSSEFDLSKADFRAVKSVEQATQRGAKVLMLVSTTETLDRALQVVQVNRKQLPLLAGDDTYSPKTLEVGGEAAVGMVVAVPWHIDANPQASFARQSKQLWGAKVNWRTALAYDATQALISAIERNPTRTGVQQTLASSEFSTQGASGTVQFLPSGDRNATVQLVKIVPNQEAESGYDFVPVPR